MKLTISEGLSWLKTLKTRHAELVKLRDTNAKSTIQTYQGGATTINPEYDAKKLDKRVTLVAREMRLCDMAIKRANATTSIDYDQDDSVLGELE